ncbi:hypothetical protein [Mycobacteroides salmoniphilum]|uniref:hypothetical protein n=1 Tax=Mycobacteroides salmoniphilum TaxID=404941 RepID=UPI000991952F|nr:hypothetical protein [Mycobacteroides salmoniphilum]QCH24425.1 hypothetical protein DSM43276_02688 [Mycobacteroides salmoniphilum]
MLSQWLPLLGSVIVASGALGGVMLSNRRADRREREKHRRDQLAAAVSELLARVEEASRQALSMQKIAGKYQRETGQPALHLGKLADEVVPASDAFDALMTKARVAQHRVELLEPQLEVPALQLVAWCLLQARPAVLNEKVELSTFQKAQHTEMQALIEAYRTLG